MLWSVKDQACPAHARRPSMAAQLKSGKRLFCPSVRQICPAPASRYGARRWLGASVAGSARISGETPWCTWPRGSSFALYPVTRASSGDEHCRTAGPRCDAVSADTDAATNSWRLRGSTAGDELVGLHGIP